MNIMILGGSGYVGSELTPYLLKKKFKLTIIDRFFFNNEKEFRDSNKKAIIIKKDSRQLVSKDFKGIDVIIDLAALNISFEKNKEFDQLTYDINYKATLRNLKIAKKSNVKKYIYPSSCSVYGFQKNIICTEKTRKKPTSSYSKAKSKIENEIEKIQSNKFNVYPLRFPTIFGYSKKMRFDLIINGMVLDCLKNQKINLLRDGSQKRPFIHIKDVCAAFHYFIKNNVPYKKPINIGDEINNTSLKELSFLIFKKLKLKKNIEWYGYKDNRSYIVSFELIKKIGFKTKYNIEYGIDELEKKISNKNFKINENTYSIKWYKKIIYFENMINKIKKFNGIIKI